jgi:phosphoglycerate dehydrogenase-like enzyme
MIIYTDLFGRTRNYSLPLSKIKEIEKEYDLKIYTTPHQDATIYWGDKFNLDHFKKMPNLKWVHLSKTGYGKFDFPQGVVVTNTPNSSEGVAEYALSIILHLLRGLNKMTLDRKSFDSNVDYILPFSKVRCLVVGQGNIGKQLKNLLGAIDIKVSIIDKTNFKYLSNLVKNNHFVINCLPLNNSTKDCFNSSVFSSMESNSYFINVGRGETVNENDLLYVLNNNLIGGAFLDVIKNEPLDKNKPFHQTLLKTPNLTISPHIANALKSSLDIQIKSFIFNMLKYKSNNPLVNIVYDSNNS